MATFSEIFLIHSDMRFSWPLTSPQSFAPVLGFRLPGVDAGGGWEGKPECLNEIIECLLDS